MDNVIDLIPQRHPIVMVDDFLGVEDTLSISRLTISESNLFVDNGVFSECGIIEHIAQSAAARIGYIFKKKTEPVPIGYIGSVNNFFVSINPRVGDTIYTYIEVIQEVFNISLIQARCKINNQEIASCTMKIFLQS